ncbi:hypothetical protein EDB19DRAFT_294670 [Suillus lakei]|nr:hypothetical protein EDB19DRAFT_294670 [Suillus lakei]
MLGTCAPSKDPHFGDAQFFFFTCPPFLRIFDLQPRGKYTLFSLAFSHERSSLTPLLKPNKTHHQTPSTMSSPDSDSLVKTQLPDLPDDWKPPSEFRGGVFRIRSKHWSFLRVLPACGIYRPLKISTDLQCSISNMSNTYSCNPVALHPSPDLGSNTSEDPTGTSISPPSTLHKEAESQLPELSGNWKPQTQSCAGRRLTFFCRLIIGKPTLEELCWGLPRAYWFWLRTLHA